MQFNSKYFIFDNIDSSMYDFILCTVQDNSDNVIQYLIDNNYEFESQKSYDDLRGICGSLLYYDFLVLKKSINH